MGSKWNMEKVFWKFLEIVPRVLAKKNTKDHGMRIIWRDMVFTSMLTVLCTVENGKITSIMEKAYMSFQTEQHIKANGRITLCMVLDFTLTQTVENGKDSTGMANFRRKDKSNCFSKSKLNSANNNPSVRFLPRSQICLRHWRRAIRKHLNKTSVHFSQQDKSSRDKSSNHTQSLMRNLKRNGLIFWTIWKQESSMYLKNRHQASFWVKREFWHHSCKDPDRL